MPGGSLQYLVVTTYEPLGSLTDYLKHNTVDWATACRMCHSIAAGLAHLHTESHDGGKFAKFGADVQCSFVNHENTVWAIWHTIF
jgi:hypothetical protein